MTTPVRNKSQYDRRLELVVGVINEHTKLDAETATKLAVSTLHAVDHIPEPVR